MTIKEAPIKEAFILAVHERVGTSKGDNNRMRADGNIPAVFYSKNNPSVNIAIDGKDFARAQRAVEQGTLSTTVFTLMFSGRAIKAIIKDIQYQITTYKVWHLDFEELKADMKVNIRVPIQLTGKEDCIGEKTGGGTLRQIIRTMKVSCLPNAIPKSFVLNVKEVQFKDKDSKEAGSPAKRFLSDIKLPAGVASLANLEDVVVVLGKLKAS